MPEVTAKPNTIGLATSYRATLSWRRSRLEEFCYAGGGRYESLAFEEQIETGALVAEEPVQTAESPDTYLEDARARLDSEGVAALATYGLQPAEDRGGYVYDGSNAMLNAVNLRPGDIITSVNGQPLGDIEQDKQLLDSWRSQPQLDIEIERDGTLLTVSYAIPEQWR